MAGPGRVVDVGDVDAHRLQFQTESGTIYFGRSSLGNCRQKDDNILNLCTNYLVYIDCYLGFIIRGDKHYRFKINVSVDNDTIWQWQKVTPVELKHMRLATAGDMCYIAGKGYTKDKRYLSKYLVRQMPLPPCTLSAMMFNYLLPLM